MISTWWNDRALPWLTEQALSSPALTALREEIAAPLHGRLLEVGFGSGPNVAVYPRAVAEVCAVEPNDFAWSRSSSRRERSAAAVHRIGLDGARIDAPAESFDSALVTFSLCTINDVDAALAEVRRLLVPGAGLAFLEHGLAPDLATRRRQQRWDPWEQRLAGGCRLTRDPVELLKTAGFTIDDCRAEQLPGPALARPWTYSFRGWATSPA